MPKNQTTMSKTQAEQKLRAAQSEIKQLRAQIRNCTCAALSPQERNRRIEEICKMINKIPAEDYDQEKLKARGLPYPPPPIKLTGM